MEQIKLSSKQIEGPYHASKWLKHQILLSFEEMQALMNVIGDCYICRAYGPVSKESAIVSKEEFLEYYRQYVEAIILQKEIDQALFRRVFCNYFTYDLSCLYGIQASEQRMIIQPRAPVVQMQFHHFFPSKIDGKFHSMVMTNENIHFGVQISCPQIYEDPKTHQFYKIYQEKRFLNAELFKKMVFWIRSHTIPTPIIFQGKRQYAPFRIGKNSLEWIQYHKQLKDQGLLIQWT